MPIPAYLAECQKLYAAGNATEHSYRPALQKLLAELMPQCQITNEPKRIACGAPDYIITRNDLPVGYIEAKDINLDLRHKTLQEQFNRYRSALDNLIITDYLYFEFYREGKLVAHIRLADALMGQIQPHPQQFAEFARLIENFAGYPGQTINSPATLARMMAAKARMMADVIAKALEQDAKSDETSELENYLRGFREHLLQDLDEKTFADLYAQTLAYGMFAARLYDTTPETFDRSEAARLLPKSNPFLRNLFTTISGERLDARIIWIVDALADIFRVADIADILKNFGKATQTADPFIHFYETFLSEYDPKLREINGVWYTPQAAVQFIVRATDHALKNHLDIPQGLRDNSKTTIKIQVPAAKQTKGGGRKTVSADKEIHRLQILDPATGTGTFLAEIIRHIHQSYAAQQGLWQSYAEQDLIPRLNGFELMMASYAVAHLKLDLVLQETGYRQPEKPRRFNVFLADSLEEHHPDTNTLFAQWLAAEANAANTVKRDTPVMVVLGNPPYYGESQNKGQWIMNLMEDYKQEPDGSGRLKERNSKWLNNDYIKFIRAAQHYIAKNGSGILAYINSNSYLDGLIHRGMRHNLMQTYDHIYILNLHGNSKKKETAPDGGKDENVFDITEGVCINLFVKTPGKKKKGALAQIHYCDLYGRRQDKYAFLQHEILDGIQWQTLEPQAPDYFFVPQQADSQTRQDWLKGIELDKLFPVNSVGIVTARDHLTIAESREEMRRVLDEFSQMPAEQARTHFNLGKDVRDWSVAAAQKDVLDNDDDGRIVPICYRPFDTRYTFFTGNSKGFHCMPRGKVMQHLSGRENIGLVSKRGGMELQAAPAFVADTISDFRFWSRPGMPGGDYIFPLYLYPEQGSLNNGFARRPNIDPAQLQTLCNQTGFAYRPAPDAEPQTLPQGSLQPKEVPVGKTSKAKIDAADFNAAQPGSFTPETLLDYIYAVLHSPAYRRRYAEFLKSGFPRIPNPENRSEFLRLAAIGSELRQWHTLQHPKADIACFITAFDSPEPDMQVDKPRYAPDSDTLETGSVYWNKTTCIRNVPAAAWQFYIGGYQPAQKWLKDRKGRILTAADVENYQKMILALAKKQEIMVEIDKGI